MHQWSSSEGFHQFKVFIFIFQGKLNCSRSIISPKPTPSQIGKYLQAFARIKERRLGRKVAVEWLAQL